MASASPRRRELLAAAGVPFELGPPHDIDERLDPALPPGAAVAALALEKARAVADRVPAGRWVLGADTLVWLAGRALGKPRDKREALSMLWALAGNEHEVFTGLALVRSAAAGSEAERVGSENTRLRMRALSADEAGEYVNSGEGLDKAGGYALQGRARRFFEVVYGPEDNVVGLPIGLLRRLAAGLPDLEVGP